MNELNDIWIPVTIFWITKQISLNELSIISFNKFCLSNNVIEVRLKMFPFIKLQLIMSDVSLNTVKIQPQILFVSNRSCNELNLLVTMHLFDTNYLHNDWKWPLFNNTVCLFLIVAHFLCNLNLKFQKPNLLINWV